MNYISRIIDKELEERLKYAGAIAIRGPKWCGKTTTAMKYSKSILEMQNPDTSDNIINIANTKPSLLLEGDKPRLIDEWQIVPNLWNAVRYSVDKISLPGQYILTGSSTPTDNNNLHSGAGRFSFLNMKPMTLYESGDSNGKISIKDLFQHKDDIDGIESFIGYEEIAYLICRGGWPNATKIDNDLALKISDDYIEAVVNEDIIKIDGVNRNPQLAREILKAYARQVSTINSDDTLYKDVMANYGNVSIPTIIDYITQFKKMYLIDEIEAWNPNIRSKTSIRTSPKKSFVDPSLATAVLKCGPKDLMLDFNTYGLLFENLVDRDLSVYINSLGGKLNHYRDRYGLEIDNVIRLDNGKYALVEVKLSAEHFNEAEEHLLKLKKLIVENQPNLGSPEFMMIVTGTNLAYKLNSGVLVVPIGCLKD